MKVFAAALIASITMAINLNEVVGEELPDLDLGEGGLEQLKGELDLGDKPEREEGTHINNL